MSGKKIYPPSLSRPCEFCAKVFTPKVYRKIEPRFCSHPCFLKSFRIPVKDKFFKVGFTVLPNGCWEWNGKRMPNGYGYLPYGAQNKLWAHCESYKIHKGPIPNGLLTCHSCDYKPCVNPDHLWLGTDMDNALDKMAKGRSNPAFGERASSAKLTDAAVIKIRSSLLHLHNQEIADIFGVSDSTISAVRLRQTWTHLL